MPSAPPPSDEHEAPGALESRAAAACERARELTTRARDALEAAGRTRRERADRWLVRYGRTIGDDVFVSRCAWCQRVREAQGERWRAAAPPAKHGFALRITHGICPVCEAGVDEEG